MTAMAAEAAMIKIRKLSTAVEVNSKASPKDAISFF